jgi:hypothetical protein
MSTLRPHEAKNCAKCVCSADTHAPFLVCSLVGLKRLRKPLLFFSQLRKTLFCRLQFVACAPKGDKATQLFLEVLSV